MDSGILFALIAMFVYGIVDAVIAVPAKKEDPFAVCFWYTGFALAVYAALSVFFFGAISVSLNLLYPFLGGIVATFAYVAFLRSVQLGALGLTASIAAAAPVVIIIFGFFLFGEVMSAVQISLVVAVILGLILISYHPIKKRSKDLTRSILFGIVTAILWAVAAIFLKASVQFFTPFQTSVIFDVSALLALAAYFVLSKKDFASILSVSKSNKKLIFLGSGIAIVAFVCMNTAFKLEAAGLVSAIIAGSALVTVVISKLHFKETVTLQQDWGASLIVAGVALLSYIS